MLASEHSCLAAVSMNPENGRRMRKLLAVVLLVLAYAGTCRAQDHKASIFLTDRSNVSQAEIGKSLDSHCPEVAITLDAKKPDYLLEAIDTHAGRARKPYKFTLFNPEGDRVFSTETARLNSAVKDVCGFIRKRKR
jgi:hypothetical protein